ncbi:DUF1275 family protein [Salinicola peritrichatus]|uniref:DUF1275 family protein n=1 Tax=Salinicola peritrichatus TaxID=1267424 RepID=UPI003B82C8EF
MLLVAGMAIQNAAHRLHLSSAPPSTLMTGTTTQVMLDLANLLLHQVAGSVRSRQTTPCAPDRRGHCLCPRLCIGGSGRHPGRHVGLRVAAGSGLDRCGSPRT